MLEQTSSVLRITALIHAALALPLGLWFVVEAPCIESHHPAWKPFKFALSIGLFLFTMAWLTPWLDVSPRIRTSIEWLLATTMFVEMMAIGAQAIRGRSSHFNETTLLDAALWKTMMAAIVITSLTMVAVALIATLRPLVHSDGSTMTPLLTLAWRGGLWLFLFVQISGFTMGGRLSRFVGGVSEQALPVVHWSTAQGDFRVSHFFALHAMQGLVLLALLLKKLALPESTGRWGMFGAIGVGLLLIATTYVQAHLGRPFLRQATVPAEMTPKSNSTGASP